MRRYLSFLPFYIVFLIPSLIFFSLIWFYFIADKLFYTTDKLPLTSMIPPFIIPGFGEYFLLPPIIVYLTALLWWMMIVYIPFVLTRKIARERKKRL